MRYTCIALMVSLAAGPLTAQTAHAKKTAAKVPAVVEDWPLWGGKNRDFIVHTSGLADSWPASGPKKIWSRALGDGYSSIAEEAGVLYTTFRRGTRDAIAALDAATGKTLWEYEYDSPFTNAYSEAVGPGPYAMPEVVGDRLVTAGGTGKIHSLDKKTSKPKWSHDLYNEFHASQLQYGYSSHALPYKDMLIFQAGGMGDGVIAFRQSDGAVVWKALQFTNSHSSPLLIDVDGQAQVVVLAAKTVFGFNPDKWRDAVVARAQHQLWAGRQHAGLGAGESAVRGLCLWHRRAHAASEPVRRQDQGGRALVRPAPGTAHRDRHPARWLRVPVERL
jgi:hypothetical protein